SVGRAIPAICALTLILMYSLEAGGSTFLHHIYSWCFTKPGNLDRARLLDRLNRAEGRHVVLVRYTSPYIPSQAEWIYNRADIDSANVIGAWEGEEGYNQSPPRFFPSRHFWLLETATATLKPYPASSSN